MDIGRFMEWGDAGAAQLEFVGTNLRNHLRVFQMCFHLVPAPGLGVSQPQGVLCPTVLGKALGANGEGRKCLFFTSGANNSLVKCVSMFMALAQKLL